MKTGALYILSLSYFSDMKIAQTSSLVYAKALSVSEFSMSYQSIVLLGEKANL